MFIKSRTTFFSGKRIKLIFFPVLFLIPLYSLASGHNYPLGSRSAAMGNASVTMSDLWSVHHNQAGLAGISTFQTGFHYENRFFVPELGLQAFAIAMPASPGTIAVSYTYFGFSRYNENKVGLAFGRKLGERISAGIRLNYLHTHIDGYMRDPGFITAEGGVIVRVAGEFLVAAHIYNPSRIGKIADYQDPLPAVLRLGVSGMAGENIMIAIEAEKEQGYETLFRAGLEMGFTAPFYLRSGFAIRPLQGSFGLGYLAGRLSADMAFTNHRVLGFSPHITINYILGRP